MVDYIWKGQVKICFVVIVDVNYRMVGRCVRIVVCG
ncbi:hypothetical protein CLOL250_02093 [Clostridium sp. L2-50]|nr:hypothetical protein CLOL250_02093 [Clostridium sp. L2-50]